MSCIFVLEFDLFIERYYFQNVLGAFGTSSKILRVLFWSFYKSPSLLLRPFLSELLLARGYGMTNRQGVQTFIKGISMGSAGLKCNNEGHFLR